jgi:predicted GNAT family N-acyltransferase
MNDGTVCLGDWTTLGADATAVRLAVFVAEQGIPVELEVDEADPASVHAVVYAAGVPVATGRLLPDAHIGRMAVLAAHRRDGLGGRVLERLVALADERGDPEVELSAQAYVCDFYARHGFVAFGPIYDDCGIPHRSMRRVLRRDRP